MTDEEAEMLGYEAVFASFVPKGDGTPLYTSAQLVEERRLAWNEAIEAAKTLLIVHLYPILSSPTRSADWHRAETAINTAIRALTKDSTS